MEAYGHVAVTGIPYIFEMYHEPTKGWYHCIAYRPTDSPDQVCVIFEDSTERRQMEEALRQTNKKLNLLSGITRHDTNNQLSSLDGCVELIHQNNPTPSVEHYLTQLKMVISQITHMIRFTQEYEQIVVRSPVWQNIRTLVNDAGNSSTLAQIWLENSIPANTEVFADPLIIKVFFNLIDIVLRRGGRISTIRFSLESRGTDLIMVYSDDGRGVAAVDKEKIFNREFGNNTGFWPYVSREILEIPA